MAQPDDFLSLAQLLRSHIGQNEAARRAVAHACYYAVYHLMAAHFGLDPMDRAGAGHGEIRDRLKAVRFTPNPPPRHVVVARRHYTTLTYLRARADCQLAKQFGYADAMQAIGIAEEIFAAIPKP